MNPYEVIAFCLCFAAVPFVWYNDIKSSNGKHFYRGQVWVMVIAFLLLATGIVMLCIDFIELLRQGEYL